MTPPELPDAQSIFCAERPDSVRLSPDGTQVSWSTTARRTEVLIAPVGCPERATTVARRDSAIRFHVWAPDGSGLLHVRDDHGTDTWQLLHSRLGRAEPRELTPHGAHADLLALSPRHPDQILIVVDDPDLGLPHVERLHLRDGRRDRIATNPGAVDAWFADPDLNVRAATAATADGGFDLIHRSTAHGPWRTVLHVPAEHALTTIVVSLPSPTEVLLVSSLDADTTALILVDTASGERRTIAASPHIDLERVLIEPRSGRPQAVSWYGDRRTWKPLDDSVADDLRLLADERRDLRIVDRSADDRMWLIALDDSARPTEFACWHRDTRELRPVSRSVSDAPPRLPVDPIRLHARDGLQLTGYWRAPPVGAAPWPTVLLVHGGPWWRDTWEHDPWRDWINDLGFGCLQINFRGSSGRGSAFAEAGVRRWGHEVIDDLEDALDTAVARGWSDPARLAGFGSSFGGYASLMLATRRRLAAVAAHNAPTDLVTFLEAIPADPPTMRALWFGRFGDPSDRTDRDRLAGTSPQRLAARIACPVLLAHGSHDSRVPVSQSHAMASALRAAGTPVEMIVLEGEGHELHHEGTTLQLANAVAALLGPLR